MIPSRAVRARELVVELGALRTMLLDRLLELTNTCCQIRSLLNLRHGQIQIVLRCRRQLGRVVQGDLSAIVAMREAVSLGTLGQQIARRPLTLNVVVGHHNVNRVFRAPLRHMAVDARGARGYTLHPRCSTSVRLAVTARTNRHVTRHRRGAARNVVGVVTGGSTSSRCAENMPTCASGMRRSQSRTCHRGRSLARDRNE